MKFKVTYRLINSAEVIDIEADYIRDTQHGMIELIKAETPEKHRQVAAFEKEKFISAIQMS